MDLSTYFTYIFLLCCCLVSQLCLTLCDPMDCCLTGSTIHEISQARILEWVAFPSPGDLPNTGIKTASPALEDKILYH